ncbi:acyl-CoA/acyl-ACP dehydrogenase [Oscillochloris sp. ZM17-4]|uniref:acyl-CoA dehydrogenase family protein n=1 Tax=Oscillochloris sp. ZM17-4 TaxID=2866714 RepID=UPI001C733F73|nr:acyl-CoA dehydrogenase family protein [Oscillochloris sp. ZM17-4]MBX0326148.1 acyl-CoA/acyl-ACP dehydrogenase [Oscillochloris sp. ZM17-4]
MSMLTPRQHEIVALADDLAARFAARAPQHDAAGSFPHENYADLRESGYLRLVVPAEYGGQGAGLFEMALAQEHLARGDGSTAMAVDMTVHLIGRLAEARSWPDPIFAQVCREIAGEGALINAAASEPELGSPSRGGMPATRATPQGDGWRVSGHKQFVSMAPALRFFVVSVALPPGPGMPEGGTGNAIIRAGSPGLRLEETWGDALSLRASGSNDLWLEDVPVPDAWLVDRRPAGVAPAQKTAVMNAWFALTMAATYLGVGQAACDAAGAYARERAPTALGRPIASLSQIQRRVGEMQVQLSAARALLHETARSWDAAPEGREALSPMIAAAKYLCTNAAVSASDQALRVAGGFGLTRQLPLERYFRDARAGLTHPPGDDAALELVGRAAMGM